MREVVIYGDSVLQTKAEQVTQFGPELELLCNEMFEAMKHDHGIGLFGEADGGAVSRDALMDTVWGGDVNVTTRTVDTHILSLRQKLEPEPGHPRYLVTAHGIGYRFIGEA